MLFTLHRKNFYLNFHQFIIDKNYNKILTNFIQYKLSLFLYSQVITKIKNIVLKFSR